MSQSPPEWSLAAHAGLGPHIEDSQYLAAGEVPWQPTGTPGFWVRPLFEDAARGERTLLMKVDPGAWAGDHVHHGELEQLYVLSGSFIDQRRTLLPGDFCCRAPGAVHHGGSHDGALALLVYSRREA